MLRVFPTLAVALSIVASGCAFSDREAVAPVRKIVKVEKTRTCTTTIRPDPAFCDTKRNCPQIDTCAEAYYRYTTCGHRWLDGGVAPREGTSPDGKPWQEPDGIPCEVKKCGKDALTMARIIEARPFSPPMKPETVCSPETS
jgi:hypothetical protein